MGRRYFHISVTSGNCTQVPQPCGRFLKDLCSCFSLPVQGSNIFPFVTVCVRCLNNICMHYGWDDSGPVGGRLRDGPRDDLEKKKKFLPHPDPNATSCFSCHLYGYYKVTVTRCSTPELHVSPKRRLLTFECRTWGFHSGGYIEISSAKTSKQAGGKVGPEDGGDMFLRNVGWNSTYYTASYPRIWYSPSFECPIFHPSADFRLFWTLKDFHETWYEYHATGCQPSFISYDE
jgi:hypothetical protein